MKKIDNYKMISTKSGDKGKSRNYSNQVLDKTDILFDTLGTIDEFSSLLGLVYHHSVYKDQIQLVKRDLQNINAIIATNPTDENMNKLKKINQLDIRKVEEIEKRIIEDCDIEARFVLPGSDSSLEGAYLDLARSTARKVERQLLKFKEKKDRNDLEFIMKYINRLSDLLFIMARSKDIKK